MKKILSLLLVFAFLFTSIPFGVYADEEASLLAEVTINPGYNLFGMVNEKVTFEKEDWYHSWWYGSQINPSSVGRERVQDGQNSFVRYTWEDGNTDLGYAAFYPANGDAISLEDDRPVYVGFKGRTSEGGFFQIGQDGSGIAFDINKHQLWVAPGEGWNYIYVDFVKSETASLTYLPIVFGVSGSTGERTLDIDDFIVSPYYRVEYYVDGELYDYAYVSPYSKTDGTAVTFTEAGLVDDPSKTGYNFAGWSLDEETAVEEISLSNADVALYALFEEAQQDSGDTGDTEETYVPTLPSGKGVGDPGVNLFGGTATYADFEDETLWWHTWWTGTQVNPETVVRTIESGDETQGKYLHCVWGEGVTDLAHGYFYHSNGDDLGIESDRPIHASLKVRSSGGGFFQFGESGGSTAFDESSHQLGIGTDGWQYVYTSFTENPSYSSFSNFRMIYGVSGTSGERWIDIDELYVAPYYKVSYMVEDEEYTYEYVCPVDETTGKYVDSASVPEVTAPQKSGYAFKFWSLDEVNEVTEISLGFEDVTLYAVFEESEGGEETEEPEDTEDTSEEIVVPSGAKVGDPGINMYNTGAYKYDFEDSTVGYIDYTVEFGSYGGIEAMKVVEDGENKALYSDMSSGGGNSHYARLNQHGFETDRPITVAFDGKGTASANIMDNAVELQLMPTVAFTSEWQTFTTEVSASEGVIIIHSFSGKSYIDNVYIAANYKFNYYVGGALYESVYVSPLNEDGSVCLDKSVYQIDDPVKPGYTFAGWTTEDGGEVQDTVRLGCKDIDLYAVWSYEGTLPGINVLTNDNTAFDFEDGEQGYVNFDGASQYVGDGVLGTEGDGAWYVYMNHSYYNLTGYGRPVAIAFKYKEESDNSDDFVQIIGNGVWEGTQTYSPTTEWQTAHYLADTTNAANLSDPAFIIYAVAGSGQLYFDDFVFAPAYCFTYYVDGEEYKTEYVSPLDNDGSFLASFAPEFEAPEKEGYKFTGWALSPSGDAVTSINLGNEDIVLYAKYEYDESYYLGEGDPMAFENENNGAYGRLIFRQNFENVSSLNDYYYDSTYEGMENVYVEAPAGDMEAILNIDTNPVTGLDKSLKLIGKADSPVYRLMFPDGLLSRAGKYTVTFTAYRGEDTPNTKFYLGVNDCTNPPYENVNQSDKDNKANKFTFTVVTDEEFENSGFSDTDFTTEYVKALNYIDIGLKNGNGKIVYIDNIEIWYEEYADVTFENADVEVSHISLKPMSRLPEPAVDDGYIFLGWSEEADGEEYTNIAKAGTYTYYPVIKSFDELGLSEMRGYEVIEELDTDGLSEINKIEYLKNVFETDSFYEKALTLAKAGIIGEDFLPYEYVTLDELSAIEERIADESQRLSYDLVVKEDNLIYDSEGTDFSAKFISAPESYLATLGDYTEGTLPLSDWFWPDHNTRLYLRHDFKVTKELEKAEMEFWADNEFDIYINGVLYTTHSDGGMYTSDVCDITESVVNGTNKVGIRLYHTNTPESFHSAMRGVIKLTYTDGSVQYLTPSVDESWKFNLVIGYYSNVEPENWYESSSLETPLYYEFESELHPSQIKRSVYMRNNFNVEKSVKSATLYALGNGEYVPYINGERVNDGRFFSGSMEKLSEYQVFDVTSMLCGGDNVLAVQTGNGWYNSTGTGNMRWLKPAVMMQLEIEYTDGTKDVFGTDESWAVTAAPLYEDDIMFGERYDARLEIDGWNDISGDTSDWADVEAIEVSDMPDYMRRYIASVEQYKSDEVLFPETAPSNYPVVKATEERAVSMGTFADTAVYYDFGTNTAGRAKIVLRNTKPGDMIMIRYAEDMGEDENMPYNEVYGDVRFVSDTREGGKAYYSARNIDYYICKGAEVEEWTPEFAYTGFRYVYIYGYEGEYTLDTVRRMEMHTGLTEVGDITTSHEGISKIWDAVKRSYKSNIFTGPTDCPTREKNFWNGDIQVFANTACWFMDNESFLGRWSEAGTKLQYDVYGWEDEEYILPLVLYKYYGNKDIIESKYPIVQALVNKREGQIKSGEIFPDGATYSPYNDHMSTVKVSEDFYAAAFYCYMYKGAAEMAEILGKTADAEEYMAKFEELRAEFNDLYYEPENHDYNQHCQGGVVIPMAFGLCDESEREALAQTLHNYVVAADYHQNSGFTSAEHLYGLLTDYGYGEDALKMLTNETYPSLLYMLSTGATTTTETWNGMYAHTFESANHYAFGNVSRWFFEYLGGIKIDKAGFDEITIKPSFMKEIGDFKVTHESRHGLIESGWVYNQSSDTYTWTVTVPAGVQATLVTPNGTEMSLTNATETYTIGADGAVTGGLDIDIGQKQSSSNVRHAEINGAQTKITENADNIFTVIPSSDMIVEIVEKTSANTPEIVSSAYYYVNADEMTYTKLSLDSYMTTDGKKSIRTKSPMGIRFRYAALTSAKSEVTEFVIDEIGFIVAVAENLGDTELTLDFSKYVQGVAYNKENGTDIVFDRSNDEVDVFTCVVRNIPVSKYNTDLTCKTYTKITVDGKQFTLYGEAVTGNVYDTAKALLETETDAEAKEALYSIILDYENTIGLPGDDLFE